MRGYFDQGAPGRAIAALASDQYGVVTRPQLLDLGLSSSAIDRLLTGGRLHRLHARVYAVGHTAPRRETRWLAAVLACGEGALLSHFDAASLSRIREGVKPRPHVSVPTHAGRAHPGIVVHRSQLHPADYSVRHRIPVTSPARTLSDLATLLDRDELARALRETQFLRLFDLPSMQAVLTRRPCRALAALVDDLVLTQTNLEDRLLAICDRYGLPRPQTQYVVLGRRMDFVWPDEKVVVETDGWEGHGTRSAFQSDRTTSNALQLAGYTILRFTDADLKRRPAKVAREIRAALGAE